MNTTSSYAVRHPRRNGTRNGAFKIRGVDFGSALGQVSVDGESILLTKTEFGTLLHLARNAGTTFSRQEIISAVQGDD